MRCRETALTDRSQEHALPHLQSLVIVLLRPILANVTAIVASQPPPLGPGMSSRGQNSAGSQGMNGVGFRPQDGGGAQNTGSDTPEPTPEEVDAARTREITSKAMTGILVLLLKWLRLSRKHRLASHLLLSKEYAEVTLLDVLKFEYLTQLLLDSNYIPLVLKLFAHQDIQQVVDSKMDRVENRYCNQCCWRRGVHILTACLSFFQFCNLRSRLRDKDLSDIDIDEELEGEAEVADEKPEESDEEDAVPPAIKRHRAVAESSETGEGKDEEHGEEEEEEEEDGEGEAGSTADDQSLTRPEVDELGYPVNPLPSEPITDFSWRNFFSLINYLRVMQKICKDRVHRNLLLVQYKSSTILRKSLRVPQPELRLYTLKLFKNQVPYCGRKWRQSNMRVITAVYLHCRPELRDEWLAGSDIDAEVDAALPLEQALRALTYWLNTRRYPGAIAAELRAAVREEQTFFARELEKLDPNWTDAGDDGMSDVDHFEGWP